MVTEEKKVNSILKRTQEKIEDMEIAIIGEKSFYQSIIILLIGLENDGDVQDIIDKILSGIELGNENDMHYFLSIMSTATSLGKEDHKKMQEILKRSHEKLEAMERSLISERNLYNSLVIMQIESNAGIINEKF